MEFGGEKTLLGPEIDNPFGFCYMSLSKEGDGRRGHLSVAIGRVYMFKIEGYIRGVEKICKDLRVKRLDLVGSAERDDFQPGRSDIDVLVEFEGLEKLFDRYFELKMRLEAQLGSQVDVIQEGAVKNPYIRRSLNRGKVRIYGS